MSHRMPFPGRELRVAALLALVAAFAVTGVRAFDTFDLDPAHSNAGFSVRHLFGMVPGRFTQVAGTVEYDAAKPELSNVSLTIQAASISTDNDKRDAHLRSADFLDATTYPTIAFKSTKIAPGEGKDHYLVTGDLTLRGVTKPVTIAVEMLGFGDTPMGVRGGFAATTTINRLDYGVSWNKALDNGGTLLGNDVRIDFPVEIVKRAPK
jgi:polyisoprenoid-binding protein YceI